MPRHPFLRTAVKEEEVIVPVARRGGLGGIADAGDPDFDPAIRGQAVDEGSPGLDGITLGAGDRVALAVALDAHLVGGQPLPIRKLATVLARASDSAWLLASEPMRSV